MLPTKLRELITVEKMDEFYALLVIYNINIYYHI